jgi:hypothetical protein
MRRQLLATLLLLLLQLLGAQDTPHPAMHSAQLLHQTLLQLRTTILYLCCCCCSCSWRCCC